jgi:hypothetical protein
MNCFACVQDCTASVLSMDLNPAFQELGDALLSAERVTSLMTQAESGTIPVFGSGYGGAFAGSGFDAMWTDLSEIVRPTRDGIHGREAISTTVDLGRHPLDILDLRFDDDGNPVTNIPPTFEIRLPILFDRMPFMPQHDGIIDALCQAAGKLGTLAIAEERWFEGSAVPPGNVVLALRQRRFHDYELSQLARRGGVIEIAVADETPAVIQTLNELNPYLFVFVRVPVEHGFEDVVERLAAAGAEVIHLDADPYRDGLEPVDHDLPGAVHAAHERLVEHGLRDATTLIASGGVVQAEHVAKAIILGADAVAVDLPLLVALECTVCKQCAQGAACPRQMESFDLSWGTQRIVNLMGSWRNQLLEVLGAMGLRDVSRLRGETGRAIFKRDLDDEIFAPIFAASAAEPASAESRGEPGVGSSAEQAVQPAVVEQGDES